MLDQLVASFWTPVVSTLPFVVTATALCLVVEYIVVRRSKVPRPWVLYGVMDGLAVASMIVVAAITLVPDPITMVDVTDIQVAGDEPVDPAIFNDLVSTQSGIQLIPFETIIDSITNSVSLSVPVSQIGGNAILFLPVAMMITARFGLTIMRGSLISVGLVVLVEVLQYFLPVARVASVDDVIIATFGIVAGAAIGHLISRALPLSSNPEASGHVAAISVDGLK